MDVVAGQTVIHWTQHSLQERNGNHFYAENINRLCDSCLNQHLSQGEIAKKKCKFWIQETRVQAPALPHGPPVIC